MFGVRPVTATSGPPPRRVPAARRVAAVLAGAVLGAGTVALPATIATAAGQPHAAARGVAGAAAVRPLAVPPTPLVTVRFGARGMTVTGPTTIHSGRVRIVASADRVPGAGQFELVQLRAGYPLARFQKQLAASRGSGGLGALRYLCAHTAFIGGVATTFPRAGSMSVTLGSGTYWLYDDGALATSFTKVILTGSIVATRSRPSSFATIAAVGRARFLVSRSTLPLAANLTFQNAGNQPGGQPHQARLLQVRSATTPAQVQAYLNSGSTALPSFATGVVGGTGPVSQGHRFVYSFALPKGRYLLLSSFRDLPTGRSDGRLGMYRFLRIG